MSIVSSDVDLRPPGLKMAPPVTVVLLTVCTEFKTSGTFDFRVTSARGTDGRSAMLSAIERTS